MIIVKNDSTDPAYNLALEEVLLTKTDEDVFMLWQNARAVIIGCNQNTVSEIDTDFTEKNDIRVVRRLTGGGAVFHDLGNLNFTFIRRNAKEYFLDFSYFNRPIIALLRDMGINAVTSERNDILADGKKISGCAQKISGTSVMHHGTLLISADMSLLSNALRPNPLKLSTKAIRSVKSRVINLSDILKKDIDIAVFKADAEARVAAEFLGTKTVSVQDLGLADCVENLKKEKYDTWEWNVGTSPDYSAQKCAYTAGGLVEARYDVHGGSFAAIRFFGDFTGVKEIARLEKELTGVRRERQAIIGALEKIGLDGYIKNVSSGEIADLLL